MRIHFCHPPVKISALLVHVIHSHSFSAMLKILWFSLRPKIAKVYRCRTCVGQRRFIFVQFVSILDLDGLTGPCRFFVCLSCFSGVNYVCFLGFDANRSRNIWLSWRVDCLWASVGGDPERGVKSSFCFLKVWSCLIKLKLFPNVEI